MDVTVDVGTVQREVESLEWETVKLRFHDFRNIRAGVGQDEVESPTFRCCGNEWSVALYPRGDGDPDRNPDAEETTSIFLQNRSEKSLKARFEFVFNPDGEEEDIHSFLSNGDLHFGAEGWEGSRGISDFLERRRVKECLTDGAMVINVRISRPNYSSLPFVPENPFLKNGVKLFMDEETADVKFEVGIQNQSGKRKRGMVPAGSIFYAHRLVLKDNAPMLAELCKLGEDSTDEPVTVSIKNVSSDIFRNLLYYTYGGKIDAKYLMENAKEIMNAADRYGIVGLKLEAEACLVKSMKVDIDNMMDHLLYADGKNCALMKEAVMDYMVANDVEILEKVSFQNFPGHLTKDLFAAMARARSNGGSNDGNVGDQFSTMRISDLRRKLHEKGLDVDGSRETMIAALRESS